MAEPSFTPFIGQRVRALRPGTGLVVVHDDTHVGGTQVALPPVEMASFYERAQVGELARALPEALPPVFSICWPQRTFALVSRTRYLGGALGAEANLLTHEIAVRRSFFGRGLDALALLAGAARSPFLERWDNARTWEERRRLEKNTQLGADADAALVQLAEIACDPTFSTFPDERLAACMRAVVNLARTGEPVVIEFSDREFLLRGAGGLDLPLSILLLAAALVPPARAQALSLRSWGWARTPELAPGLPAFSCIAVPESSGVPKRVLPGARLIRADGSTDRPFPDDGTGKLVTAAVAVIRAARIDTPENASGHMRVLRVLAAHAAEEIPAAAVVWRAGRRAVSMAAVAAGVRCAAEAREPGEGVRLLAERGPRTLADPEVLTSLDQLLVAINEDDGADRYLGPLLALLQQGERYDLLGGLRESARTHLAVEVPVLAWLCAQEDLSRVLDLVADAGAADVLRAASCGALPHGYRALASLLRVPGKPSPRLRALWAAGAGDESGSETRELLVALVLFARAPRSWDIEAPGWVALSAWLRQRMEELLAHDAAGARKERRPRGASALMLAAQLDAAAACDGCGHLLRAAVSGGGRDLDAWILFLDRFAPEQGAWWARALGAWRGALGDELRSVLPDVARRAGTTPLEAGPMAREDGMAAQLVAALNEIRAGHRPRALPGQAQQSALGLAWYQR